MPFLIWKNILTAKVVAFLVVVFLAAGYLLTTYLINFNKRNQPKKMVIAFVGRQIGYPDPATDSDLRTHRFDMMHYHTLSYYIDEFNRSNARLNLELHAFDIKKSIAEIESLYRDSIGPNTDILLVIDNTWGREFGATRNSIIVGDIPVIQINADKNGLDFEDFVLFLGNDDEIKEDIITFLDMALEPQKLVLIAEDSSGYRLSGEYLRLLHERGIEIHHQFWIENPTSDVYRDSISLKNLIDNISRTFKKKGLEKDSTVILLAGHKPWTIGLIEHLFSSYSNKTILGGMNIFDLKQEYVSNKKKSGNQIIMANSAPTFFETTIQYQNKSKFPHLTLQYYKSYKLNENLYHKRCMDILQIAKQAMEYAADTNSMNRYTMIDFFKSLKGNYFETDDDIMQFDSTLVYQRHATFNLIEQSKVSIYPIQLNSGRSAIIPNVDFGIEILDIDNVDVGQNTFEAEFTYWLSYRKKGAIKPFKIEETIMFRNMDLSKSKVQKIKEVDNDSIQFLKYQVSGTFDQHMNIEDFPFDSQHIQIEIEMVNSIEDMMVTIDKDYVDIKKNPEYPLSIYRTSWNYVDAFTSIDNIVKKSGSKELDRPFKSKVLKINHIFKREPWGAIISIFIPLFSISFISIFLLFLRKVNFANLGRTSAGVFLSIVAYTISYYKIAPLSNYPTKADLLWVGSFICVLVSFLFIIFKNSAFFPKELDNNTFSKYWGGALGLLYLAWVVFVIKF